MSEPKLEVKPKESILARKKIEAPANFVSIFHETKTAYLPAIDEAGLRTNSGNKNIGEASIVERKNVIINKYCPPELKAKGIGRGNIYGYPYLEYGHGLMGADERYKKVEDWVLRDRFEMLQRSDPNYWSNQGINSVDEYVALVTSPKYLREQYPGEILEAKVDPERCYVGDLDDVTHVLELFKYGWEEDETLTRAIGRYWQGVISLADFLKWYKKPEWAEDGDTIKDGDSYRDGEPSDTGGFLPIKGAPAELPFQIKTPEVLIPEDIPQEHIRVLE